MARQVRTPSRGSSSLGKVAGIGAGVAGALTGGLGYLAVPGALSALTEKPDTVRPVQGSSRAVVNSPNRPENPLGSLAGVANIARSAVGIKQSIDRNAQENAQPQTAVDRRLAGQPPKELQNLSQQDALFALRDAEQILNELNDPELNQMFRRPILEAMMVGKQRILQGQEPYQPGVV